MSFSQIVRLFFAAFGFPAWRKAEVSRPPTIAALLQFDATINTKAMTMIGIQEDAYSRFREVGDNAKLSDHIMIRIIEMRDQSATIKLIQKSAFGRVLLEDVQEGKVRELHPTQPNVTPSIDLWTPATSPTISE